MGPGNQPGLSLSQIKVAVEAQPELYSLIYVPKPLMVPGGRFIEYYYW